MNHSLRSKTKRNSGASQNEDSVIEVNVHSPIRQYSKVSSSPNKSSIFEADVVANWLLSKVDMSRYLSRTCYYLEKIDGGAEKRLRESLKGFKIRLLRQVRNLEMLDSEVVEFFRHSEEFKVLKEIVSKYE